MTDIYHKGFIPSKPKSPKRRLCNAASLWIAEALEPRRLLSAVQFNPTNLFTADSNVGSFVQFSGQGYFAAGPSAGNSTLYRTDLTPNGTSAVLDEFTTLPNSFVAMSGGFLFLAGDATHGQ